MAITITRGKKAVPIKCVIYGAEGIGKSTFASQFPDPVFIDTEGSTARMDVARVEPESWEGLLQAVEYFRKHTNECRTLVVDTLDWAERMCIQHVVMTHGWNKEGIEQPGFGRGYKIAADEFKKLLVALDEVAEKGIHIVCTAHAMMRKFEQPDEQGSYDRWEMKLSKHNSPMVKEWCDMLLFANYKTFIVGKDKSGKGKGRGGARVMYTQHDPCWDAKNRFGLDAELPFEYDQIGSIITGKPVEKPVEKFEEVSINSIPFTDEVEEHDEVPEALLAKMRANDITPLEVRWAVAEKGYFDGTVKIEEYGEEFIENLVECWDAVEQMIMEQRGVDDLPF